MNVPTYFCEKIQDLQVQDLLFDLSVKQWSRLRHFDTQFRRVFKSFFQPFLTTREKGMLDVARKALQSCNIIAIQKMLKWFKMWIRLNQPTELYLPKRNQSPSKKLLVHEIQQRILNLFHENHLLLFTSTYSIKIQINKKNREFGH